MRAMVVPPLLAKILANAEPPFPPRENTIIYPYFLQNNPSFLGLSNPSCNQVAPRGLALVLGTPPCDHIALHPPGSTPLLPSMTLPMYDQSYVQWSKA